MRPSRPAAAAAAAALLAAAGVIACAGAGRSARGPTAEGIVTIRPDAEHAVASARATPPTTQFCQQHYHIACYQPRQIREAYNLPGAVPAGDHRPRPDDRHRGLVRLPDRPARPAAV